MTSTLLEPPIGSTVAERIEQSPYVKTDVFKKSSMLKQALNSQNNRQDTLELVFDSRTKSMISHSPNGDKRPIKLNSLNINVERLNLAKDSAERAIKSKKIFTIQGPYSHVREALRRRGWIEKFYKVEAPVRKSPRSKKIKASTSGGLTSDDSDADNDIDDDGDDDNDDDEIKEDDNAPKPWEEENGIYGIMSRLAKNCAPQFIWCIRRDAIDFRYLRKDQMVNHYGLNGAFTTKVGLCTNLRSAHWFEDVAHETFFPRCYRLSHEEEKGAFIDDYYMTACMSIIKWVIMRNNDCYNSEVPSDGECDYDLPVNQLSLSSDQTKVDSPDLQSSEVSKSISGKPLDQKSGQNKDGKSPRKEKKPRKALRLPMSLLDSALQQCEQFLRFKQNEDLEEINEQEMLNIDWDMFLQQYYSLCHNKGVIPGTRRRLSECERMANQLRRYFPQFDLDGVKNLWIVKPGAKSRGRGIFCSDKLHDMLKLVDSVVRKDSKFVVQKYIERPLIIFETKFDIRQWFLVTDWNPLTIWWYKDFYLRFCKKNFTLEELDEVIHLSNNSIQKNYTVDPTRSKEIPADSMWASDDEFLDFLQKRGHGTAIDEIIRPGMQKSVICALLTTRDIVEYRKSSFELYGADFMLTEDYKPWLLEINSSPTLAPSTHVTKRLCDCVVEDTMKVVIDRKQDKNCDTGRFELIYKAVPVTIPQYLGINLSVEGNSLNTPTVHISKPRKINVPESLYQTPKIDLTSSVNLISKKEKKKQSLKLIHKDKESSPEAKETVNTENSEKSKVTEKSEKPLSEPGSAKYEREGLLFKRKRHSTRSVEVPKSQLDLMKPTDSYLKKIREGVKDSQKVLTEEAGASNRSFCPKCGSNGIIKLHHNEACICQQDSIQNTISSDVITQFRNPTGFFTRAGIVNHTSRSKVLKVLNRDPASQLILPLAPRRLIINPPDILPISATTSAATNLSKFLNSSSGLNFNSVTDTFPYRKAKKQKSKFQKSFPEQTMFVLAESYTQKL